MLMKSILEVAKPKMEGRTVKDLIVGISLIACELDNGNIGISYVLRDGLPSGCSVFSFVQDLISRPAIEVADLIISGTDNLQRAIASSILSAASFSEGLTVEDNSIFYGMDIKSTDTVGMIGLIPPLVNEISGAVKELIVFDEGLSLHGGNYLLKPMEMQAELLPKCDIVFLSGTTTINGSIDSLLQMCKTAKEVVLVGPSTPLYPDGFKGTLVTRLAGSCWAGSYKDEVFKIVSLAGGIRHMQKYMIKKVLTIK